MDTKTVIAGIVLSLLVGTGTGYILSPDSTSNPELFSQIEEHQNSIRTLENDNTDLQASLTSAMNTNTELQTTLISTEGDNNDLHNILNDIQTYVDSVETQITTVQGGLGSPDYDSGWIRIDPGETKSMEHGLGTDEDLFVYVIGRYREGQTNQLYYGLGYHGDVEIGNGWTMDDTFISITRGVADVHWDETHVYIWRIPQGPAGPTIPTGGDSIPDAKYIPILLKEEETVDISGIVTRIVDLEGYKEVYISCYNYLKNGAVLFTWVIEDGDEFVPVREILSVYSDDEYSGGLYRVQGKYLEILVGSAALFEGGPQAYEQVRILLYATK